MCRQDLLQLKMMPMTLIAMYAFMMMKNEKRENSQLGSSAQFSLIQFSYMDRSFLLARESQRENNHYTQRVQRSILDLRLSVISIQIHTKMTN